MILMVKFALAKDTALKITETFTENLVTSNGNYTLDFSSPGTLHFGRVSYN